jgi:hypothetical protein
MDPSPKTRRVVVVGASLILATLVWLPAVHLFFRPPLSEINSLHGVPPKATAMAERHLRLWSDPAARQKELTRMRRSNAEWDFMGRTFRVMSLAELAVREPALAPKHLPVMDTIIDETLRLEAENGCHYFLMPYSKSRPYLVQPERSLFIDGEIAMMLAMRRTVEEQAGYREQFQKRIKAITDGFARATTLALESYPDECWTFDHTMALASIRLGDRLDTTDHADLLQGWLAMAKRLLTDPKTGLLVSSYTTGADPLDGPEGSSIWLVSHCLRLIDEGFARDQFERAKVHLKRELCGLAWSREWPPSWDGPLDIDSGAVVPILEVSAGGSGLAFIGAASFGDMDVLKQLHTTLDFAALPVREDNSLRYAASNQVGDSAILYSLVLGPIWQRVLEDAR